MKGTNSDLDSFKKGDIVFFKGQPHSILECHGKNWSGVFEYYIQELSPIDKNCVLRKYVTELEITKDPDTPPAIPGKECNHSKAYLNHPISSLKFWVCPDCKKELKGKE